MSTYKTVAIIIGFEYKYDNSNLKSERYLPGIIVDMHQAYNFAINFTSNIIVITDVEEDEKWYEIFYAIRDNTVNMSVLNFIQTIKNNNNYFKYTNKENFSAIITNNIMGADRLFFYYTGHGSVIHVNTLEQYDAIELPLGTQYLSYPHIENKIENKIENDNSEDLGDNLQTSDNVDPELNYSLLTIEELKDIFFVNQRCEYIFIFDCCYGTDMNLPYIFNDVFKFNLNKKTINSMGKNIILRPYKFYKNNIICISSKKDITKQISSNSGSLFTKLLFKVFATKNKSLQFLVANMLHPEDIDRYHNSLKEYTLNGQEVTISSSYPNLIKIFPWVYGLEKNCQVVIDKEHNFIRLKKLK